ncbi:NUDIX domain-containing protein [Streptomyces stramineus]
MDTAEHRSPPPRPPPHPAPRPGPPAPRGRGHVRAPHSRGRRPGRRSRRGRPGGPRRGRLLPAGKPPAAPPRRRHRRRGGPRDAARRECEEETGRYPHTLRPLTVYHPMPSRTSAVTHMFLATDLGHGTARRDPTEAGMTVRWVPLDDAVRAVESGAVQEAGSVIGLLLAARLVG